MVHYISLACLVYLESLDIPRSVFVLCTLYAPNMSLYHLYTVASRNKIDACRYANLFSHPCQIWVYASASSCSTSKKSPGHSTLKLPPREAALLPQTWLGIHFPTSGPNFILKSKCRCLHMLTRGDAAEHPPDLCYVLLCLWCAQ